MSYVPTDVVSSVDEIRAVIPGEFESQQNKVLDHIDELCRAWIERSSFIMLATVGADGRLDVSPKGDPAGFVKVLDPHTLAIPDRPGNHRFDGFRNILETGRIAITFLVPTRNEVIRVSGSAQVIRDEALRKSMAINGRTPDFAILVKVEEAFFHCGKAVIRSALWAPGRAFPAHDLPTYGQALLAHGRLSTPLEEMEARLKNNDENRLYDE